MKNINTVDIVLKNMAIELNKKYNNMDLNQRVNKISSEINLFPATINKYLGYKTCKTCLNIKAEEKFYFSRYKEKKNYLSDCKKCILKKRKKNKINFNDRIEDIRKKINTPSELNNMVLDLSDKLSGII